ncbi:uncharacterized protein N7525_004537 [Penicillium rubens]|uniref:uncharacterized protein n=1 Tax=Penicillium rubens TaxID=1108849 RepID=UPI002A5A6953|nr:uncharacterized protein N7525_004537 [Penicillium rubens]KAJ5839349.1 hypothetical protein N7525_004537 [Penicillium rubens]
MSSIGLCWSCTPAANAVVVGLGLVLFGSVLVVLYWRARRGRRRAVDLTVSQGDMVSIPTWKRSYGLDLQQPYRRRPYWFEGN